MKVIIPATGKAEEYDRSYALRLIDQGIAVPAPAEERKAAKATVETVDKIPEKAETAAEEKAGKNRKNK